MQFGYVSKNGGTPQGFSLVSVHTNVNRRRFDINVRGTPAEKVGKIWQVFAMGLRWGYAKTENPPIG